MPHDKVPEEFEVFGLPGRVNRRKALGLIGRGGLGVLAAACGGKQSVSGAGSPSATPSSSAAASATPTASAAVPATCTLTSEETEGPYYINLNLIRADITEGKPGTPLKLMITVRNSTTCHPIQNAAVDVWHCDAGGVYSGYGAASTGGGPGGGGTPTDKLTFLRGIQMTDALGVATIQTIYPGWYRGRAVHIHVKVHVGSNVVHTGQLFFPDDLTDKVYRADPYAARGTRDVLNSADSIFTGGGSTGIPTMTQNGSGHTGAITLSVRQT